MTMINYYEEFATFVDKKNDASVFAIIVETTTGEMINSSSIPIAVLERVIAAIETADASQTALSIWNHNKGDMGELVVIPHHKIAAVRLVLR